jgi:hypothetical protein
MHGAATAGCTANSVVGNVQIIRGRQYTAMQKRHFPNKVIQFQTQAILKIKNKFEIITFLERDQNFHLRELKRNETKLDEGCSYYSSRRCR